MVFFNKFRAAGFLSTKDLYKREGNTGYRPIWKVALKRPINKVLKTLQNRIFFSHARSYPAQVHLKTRGACRALAPSGTREKTLVQRKSTALPPFAPAHTRPKANIAPRQLYF